jgi:hypothetical protein
MSEASDPGGQRFNAMLAVLARDRESWMLVAVLPASLILLGMETVLEFPGFSRMAWPAGAPYGFSRARQPLGHGAQVGGSLGLLVSFRRFIPLGSRSFVIRIQHFISDRFIFIIPLAENRVNNWMNGATRFLTVLLVLGGFNVVHFVDGRENSSHGC